MPDSGTDEPRRRLARELAARYGKRNGILVSTGSAALEIALFRLGVGAGDEVLIPALCCHQVASSVLRLGATPVLVEVDGRLSMSLERVEQAITPSTTAVVAVHYLGLPCDVAGMRRLVGSRLPIVEDASLAWDLRARGVAVGAASDAVVTSFGATKPVSVGEGGAVFADDPDLATSLDRDSDAARMRPVPAFPFPLSPHALPHFAHALSRADERLGRRRLFVERARPVLERGGFAVWSGTEGDRPSWHRLPVWAPGRVAAVAAELQSARALGVQRPHDVALVDLPMLSDRARTCGDPRRIERGGDLLLDRTDAGPGALEDLEQWVAEVAELSRGGGSRSAELHP